MSEKVIQLKLENVSKSYQGASVLEVLNNISFSMQGGEAVAITGPSGSGKSTLLRLIGTLESPTSGSL